MRRAHSAAIFAIAPPRQRHRRSGRRSGAARAPPDQGRGRRRARGEQRADDAERQSPADEATATAAERESPPASARSPSRPALAPGAVASGRRAAAPAAPARPTRAAAPASTSAGEPARAPEAGRAAAPRIARDAQDQRQGRARWRRKSPIRLSRMIASLASRVAPPPKPSATIGEPVLVQGARRQNQRGDREGRRQQRRQGEARRRSIEREPADRAHHRAGERRRPGDARPIGRRRLARRAAAAG